MPIHVHSERIQHNLDAVRGRIERAAQRAGRDPGAVRIIAVTKGVGLPEVQALWGLGITDFGENRIEVARDKIERAGFRPRWHMIGSIQRRKARDVVRLFDTVDAIDRVELAVELEKRCAEQGRRFPVLVEVNASGETSKHGVSPDGLTALLDVLRGCEHLSVEGLMTMAPYVDDPEQTRPVFAVLRELAERYGLRELSMGMTNDFDIAVEEGATQVRIGTALFE